MFYEMKDFIQQQFLSHVIHSETRFDNFTDTLNNLWTNETEFTEYFNHQKIEETVIALKQLLRNPIVP
jgi:hypothetical protein